MAFLYLRKSATNVEAIPLRDLQGGNKITVHTPSNLSARLTDSTSTRHNSSIVVRSKDGRNMMLQRSRSLDLVETFSGTVYFDRCGNCWRVDNRGGMPTFDSTGIKIPANSYFDLDCSNLPVLNYGSFGFTFRVKLTSLSTEQTVLSCDLCEVYVRPESGKAHVYVYSDYLRDEVDMGTRNLNGWSITFNITYANGVLSFTYGSNNYTVNYSRPMRLTWMTFGCGSLMYLLKATLQLGTTSVSYLETPNRTSIIEAFQKFQWTPASGEAFSLKGTPGIGWGSKFKGLELGRSAANTGIYSTCSYGINLAAGSCTVITMECWIYGATFQTSAFSPIVLLTESESSGGKCFGLLAANSPRIAVFNIGGGLYYASDGFALNTWNHVGVQIQSNGTMWIFINGVCTTHSIYTSLSFTATRCCIGYNPCGDTSMTGQPSDSFRIADVRIRFSKVYDSPPSTPTAPFELNSRDDIHVIC